MILTVLAENTTLRPELGAEHGLSLHIVSGGRQILFDAGQSDLFLRNSRKLGIDLSEADFGVLSHGHYDHGGGLPYFLAENKNAPVYVNPRVFGAHYNGRDKYIGLAPELRKSDRLIPVEDGFSPAPGMRILEGREPVTPIESFGLNVCRNGQFQPDRFPHEQYLSIREAGRQILFSGCSHQGILNICRWFRPDVLVGGFHFKKLDPIRDRQVLESAARQLLEFPTRYYTCHCTGTEQYQVLKEIMGDRLSYLSTGTAVEL